jgi:TatD family hydrolase
MLVDSHCHLDFPDFAPELDDVVARARAAGVGAMLTISTRVAKAQAYRALAERYADVFFTIGTHPHQAAEEPDVSADELVALAAHPRCVGVGEAGLDYHYGYSPKDVSERVFRTHIAAARATGLPLVIHARDADEDMIRILEDETGQGAFKAVLHCFSSGPELAAPASGWGSSSPSRASSPSTAPKRSGPSPPRSRWTGCWWRRTRPIWRRRRIAESATSRPMWSTPTPCSPGSRA